MTTSSALEEELASQIKHSGLPTPGREVRFWPGRKFRFDFAWGVPSIVVEVEGATYANGRHTRGSGFEKDCEKYNEAAIRGWTVLRFTGAMVKDGRAIESIQRVFA